MKTIITTSPICATSSMFRKFGVSLAVGCLVAVGLAGTAAAGQATAKSECIQNGGTWHGVGNEGAGTCITKAGNRYDLVYSNDEGEVEVYCTVRRGGKPVCVSILDA